MSACVESPWGAHEGSPCLFCGYASCAASLRIQGVLHTCDEPLGHDGHHSLVVTPEQRGVVMDGPSFGDYWPAE